MLVYGVLTLILLWDCYFFSFYLVSLWRNDNREKNWRPLVSVIVPAYNEERNVKTAVASLLESGYPSLEVIVVDDGSSDRTFEAASSVRDERVRVIRKRHGGKASAINTGLKLAKGEIIVVMDADSVLSPGSIDILVRRFYDDDVVAVGGQVRVLVDSLLSLLQDVEHLRIAMFRRAREMDNLGIAPGPLSAFRRETLIKGGGFPMDLVEDYAVTLKLKDTGKVVYAPKAVVWTRMHSSLGRLWRQRVRWTMGDLTKVGISPMRDVLRIIVGDAVAFADVILLPMLYLYSKYALLLWVTFEVLTMAVPTAVEGAPMRYKWVEIAFFPAILYFWALFYLTVHLYCYVRYLIGRKESGWV